MAKASRAAKKELIGYAVLVRNPNHAKHPKEPKFFELRVFRTRNLAAEAALSTYSWATAADLKIVGVRSAASLVEDRGSNGR